MNKQKDFEKGWEEYKAKRKQEIEEMVKIIQKAVGGCSEHWAKLIAEELHKNRYRKTPKEKTILTNSDVGELLNIVAKDTRKETAEKFAKMLKSLVAERNCNEDYDWEDVQIDGQIFVECIDEICKGLTGNV